MEQPLVLVIGSTNIDYVMKLPHLPGIGETVTDGKFLQGFGGKGANQAVAARRAGAQVAFVTCLGQDLDGDQAVANFRADGIDTDYLIRHPQWPTGTALVMCDQAGRNYLAVAPGSNDGLTPAALDHAQHLFARCPVVVLQMEVPPQVNHRALQLAMEHQCTVVFNYAPTRGLTLPIDARMSVLVVNENEAAELLGGETVTVANAGLAAKRLRADGPGVAVITLGEAGAIAVSESEEIRIPGHKVAAVDSTAAGDTFCGALATALADRQTLSDSLMFANTAAALATTQLGAQPSIPHRESILKMLPAQSL